MEKLNAISSAIIGAAIEVHKRLGPGLLESTYHACLVYKLQAPGFDVQTQVPLPLIYKVSNWMLDIDWTF